MMKRSLLRLGVLAGLSVAGCGEKEEPSGSGGGAPAGGSEPKPAATRAGDTVETLFEEVEVQLDNFSRALSGAKRNGSAAKFSEITDLVSGEMKSIAARLSRLEVPSEEVKEQFSARMEAREEDMQKTFGDLDLFLEGLDAEVQSSIRESLAKFMEAMGEVDPTFSKYFDVKKQEAAPPIPPPVPAPIPPSE